MTTKISRRTILASSVVAASGGLAVRAGAQAPSYTSQNSSSDVRPKEPDFQYSYARTDAQWRAQLSDFEYSILREGKTEPKKSSPLWKENRPGAYRCKGCNLLAYSSDYKVVLKKGWVFFRQGEPDSILMGIDLVTSYGGKEKNETAIEAHCRRCGSHLGHVLYVKGEILHCINGTSLNFIEA